MTKTVKIILISALSLVMAALVFYCVQFGQTPEEKLAENPTVSTEDALQTAEQLSAAAETAWQNGTAKHITLSDEGSSASASGVQIQGKTVTITSSGIYSVSGTLTEGQLAVDCDDTVVLILDSVEITNPADAAICISNADHTLIYLPESSSNKLVSGTEQEITAASGNTDVESASGAALYARDSLSITGNGKLAVAGYINNAVATTDHLIVLGGELELTAVNNGLKGKDSVTVLDGTINIHSGNDGIKSNNDVDADCGNIDIRGGEINIISLGDGIQAEKNLSVENGIITISAGDTETIDSGKSVQSFENLPDNMRNGMNGKWFESLQIEGITKNDDGSITVSPEAAEQLLSMAKEFFGSSDVTLEDITACTSYEALMELFGAGMNFDFSGTPGRMEEGSMPQGGDTPPDKPNGTAPGGFSGNGEGTGFPGSQGGMNPQGGETPPELPNGTEQGGFPGNQGGMNPQGGETPPEMPQGTQPQDRGGRTDRGTENQSNPSGDMRGHGGMRGDFSDMFDREWSYSSDSEASTKGLKSGGNLTVSGGSITVNSVDDCIHANGSITVTGGTFRLSTGDDGFHADDTLTVSDGDITISQSYEGLEGHLIYLCGGNISVTAADDGINACGGSSGMFGRMPGASDTDSSSLPILKISGGTLCVNAGGDGLDSNGDLIIEGGNIIVDGPTDNGNGALDSGSENGGSLLCNGGTILAIGASGMAESFESDSTQCSFIKNFSGTMQAGTQITVSDESGKTIFEYKSAKTFNSVVFSSPELVLGSTYTIAVGDQTETITIESISNGGSSGFNTPGGFGKKGRK